MAQAQSVEVQYETVMKGASIDFLVPPSCDFDILPLLRDGPSERLSSAPSRRNLFLDENMDIFIVLKTAVTKSEDIESLLPDVEVTVSAHATDAVPQGSGNAASASGKHDLISTKFPAAETTAIITTDEWTYAVWKRKLHIPRPRVRLQRPAVYFTATIGVAATATKAKRQSTSDTLSPFELIPGNVLDPLRLDPSLRDANVYLSEQRITKVAPGAGRAHAEVKPIRGASKRAFPVVPALFTKVRYSALPQTVVASLHLETSQLISETVSIRSAVVKVEGASVEAINPVDEPILTHSGDETVLLYKLTPVDGHAVGVASTLVVNIQASISLDQNSDIDLDITWHAQVDLSQTMMKPRYKWSRPLSGGAVQAIGLPPMQAGSRPTSIDTIPATSMEETGIIFNFTAPRTVAANSDFQLHVQCVNRSTRTRRFALVVVSKRASLKAHTQPSSGESVAGLVSATIDDPPKERSRPPDALDLDPDVRVGPLPAGACFETQMKFRAIARGVLDLGVVRIVDLDTRQTVDVKELPDIFVS